MTAHTLDLLIALDKGERVSTAWWARRWAWAANRAGRFPADVADLVPVSLVRQTDPDTGERFACVTLPFPEGTPEGRIREIAHMLTSMTAAEGYTLRRDGKRTEELPGEEAGVPEGSLGEPVYTQAQVCSGRCLTCVFSTETRIGCCGQGAAFSLADIGAALLAGEEAFVERILTLPGEADGDKRQLFLNQGRCIFHDPSRGCTLDRARMPLQCRTYLCYPEKLLPPELLADYTAYVDALDEEEAFVGDHMRLESKVGFDSPLAELKEAARKAFAAWAAGK